MEENTLSAVTEESLRWTILFFSSIITFLIHIFINPNEPGTGGIMPPSHCWNFSNIDFKPLNFSLFVIVPILLNFRNIMIIA